MCGGFKFPKKIRPKLRPPKDQQKEYDAGRQRMLERAEKIRAEVEKGMQMSLFGPQMSLFGPSFEEAEMLPEAYGGCTCDCHRHVGVKHVMPCCYPARDEAFGGYDITGAVVKEDNAKQVKDEGE